MPLPSLQARWTFTRARGRRRGRRWICRLFTSERDSALDFNGTAKNAVKGAIVFRGAYAGEGGNPGWKLQAGIKPATDADYNENQSPEEKK